MSSPVRILLDFPTQPISLSSPSFYYELLKEKFTNQTKGFVKYFQRREKLLQSPSDSFTPIPIEFIRDRNVLLLIANKRCSYSTLPYDLLEDKQLVLDLISHDPNVYKSIAPSSPLRKDKDVILKCLNSSGFSGLIPRVHFYLDMLSGHGREFSNDKEFWLEVIEKYNLSRVRLTSVWSDSLRKDKEILRALYAKNIAERVLIMKSDDPFSGFMHDYEEILGENSKYVNTLRRDRDFILYVATHVFGKILHYTPEFRNDKEIVMACARTDMHKCEFSSLDAYIPLEEASERLRSDKDVVRVFVKYCPQSFKFASKALRNDLDFMGELVDLNPLVYNYLNEGYRTNGKLIIKALSAKDDCYDIPKSRQRVISLIHEMISHKCFRSLANMHQSFWNDKELSLNILIAGIETGYPNIAAIPFKMKDDKEFLLKCIENGVRVYECVRFLSDELKNDCDFVWKIVKQIENLISQRKTLSKHDIVILPREFRNIQDKELIRSLVKIFKYSGISFCLDEILSNTPQKYLTEKDFIMELLDMGCPVLAFIPIELTNDIQIVSRSVINSGNFSQLPVQFKKDRQVIFDIVEKCKEDLFFDPGDMTLEFPELVELIVERTGSIGSSCDIRDLTRFKELERKRLNYSYYGCKIPINDATLRCHQL